ncbi:MAG: hypothetical protein ACTS27_08915 [Phycisphaerales bacterium]
MLNLDCPNCGKPHRIDSAFRGGVARCDSCGALIHVPTKDGKPIEAQSGKKKRPGEPDRIVGEKAASAGRRRKAAPKGARRLPGKPVTITLVALIVALSAAAAWVIYQTAMNARGGG